MSSLAKTEKKPVKFEWWIRILCPDKECDKWTSMPASDAIPEKIVCCVCRKHISLKGFPGIGFTEFKSRGMNGQVPPKAPAKGRK